MLLAPSNPTGIRYPGFLILWLWTILACFSFPGGMLVQAGALREKEIPLASIGTNPVYFRPEATDANELTWWFPPGFDALAVPMSAGLIVDRSQTNLMQWLREGSPWG